MADPHDAPAFLGLGALLLGAWGLLVLLGAGLTVLLVRRLWKNWRTASLVAKALSAAAVAAATLGAAGQAYGALSALLGIFQNEDPAAKARVLAEGISVAMNCTAASFIVWSPSILVAWLLLRTSRPLQ
jgi:hypothetical protein